ncbi:MULTISPECIES: peptidoglycan-binding protein [Actinoplanes]|uniref:efflux RND transporter periplasmic adaptor subunit n=1 Tax=Actinoplanes TaxID=1865 RepID=UPI0005F29061|nr:MULTISPECIES: peptidoglycan-binding protein [Actinoplanes]GLY05711.1 peptidoglycan-binding protein [Actinoplanes sp. NBRC 101535]
MGAKRVAGVVAVGAVAAAITVFSLPRDGDDSGSSGATAPTTATATEETLVDRQSVDGTLAYGDPTSITTRGSGTVTQLPAEGTTIGRGKALYRLDDRPVTLLYGRLPAYRELKAGVKGSDVKQFESNLWALGYRGFTVDSTYSSATADVVEDWQDDLGVTETGVVTTSQIMYAPGEARVNSLTVQVGALVGSGSEVLKVTGTTALATVPLGSGTARLAENGAAVQVRLPDGETVPGKIAKIATVVTENDNGGANATTYNVTIRFDAKAKVRSQGAAVVSVAFTVGQRPNVLTVPVTALVVLAEGGFGLQVYENGTTTPMAVETGLFADGKVEVKGTGLQAGMQVVVPS